MKNLRTKRYLILNFIMIAYTLPVNSQQSVPGLAINQNQGYGLSQLQTTNQNQQYQQPNNQYGNSQYNNSQYNNSQYNSNVPGLANTSSYPNQYQQNGQYSNNNQPPTSPILPYGANSNGMPNNNNYQNYNQNYNNQSTNNAQNYQQGQAVRNQFGANAANSASDAPGAYLDQKLDSIDSGFTSNNTNNNSNNSNSNVSTSHGHPMLGSFATGLGRTAMSLAPYAGMYALMRSSGGMGGMGYSYPMMAAPMMYPMMYGGYGYGGYGGMGSFGGMF